MAEVDVGRPAIPLGRDRFRVDAPSVTRWSLGAAASPAWKCWDGEYVVHHLLANDTHRLSEPAGQILECLTGADGRSSQDIARACSMAEEEALVALAALAEVGLVEQC